MLTFSSFVLLVAGAQGADRNLLAKEDTWSGDLTQTSMGARRALDNDVGFLSFITKPLPIIPPTWQVRANVAPFAFLVAILAFFSSLAKMIFHNKCPFSKFLVNLMVMVATGTGSYSSAQTTVAFYEAAEVQTFQDWLMEYPITRTTRVSAVFVNLLAFILALIGYRNFVTYPLSMVGMAATTYGNWPVVRDYSCKLIGWTKSTHAFCKLEPLA